jgi:hypothetical protein
MDLARRDGMLSPQKAQANIVTLPVLISSKKVLNRIDLKITIWACVAFFGLDLGRGNLQQANSDSKSISLSFTGNMQAWTGLSRLPGNAGLDSDTLK